MEIITAVFDAVVGWVITTITNAIDWLWPTVNCDEWEHPADHYPGGTWPDGSLIPEGILRKPRSLDGPCGPEVLPGRGKPDKNDETPSGSGRRGFLRGGNDGNRTRVFSLEG